MVVMKTVRKHFRPSYPACPTGQMRVVDGVLDPDMRRRQKAVHYNHGRSSVQLPFGLRVNYFKYTYYVLLIAFLFLIKIKMHTFY